MERIRNRLKHSPFLSCPACLFKLWIILFCYTTPLCHTFAQSLNYINYDTDDGLPSSEVYDIELADDGSLWFTTDRGVSHFNGYEFQTYTTNDGLVNNTNFEICKDKNGRRWFNAFDGRLSYYEDGQFHPYEGNDSLVRTSRWEVVENIAFTQGDNSLLLPVTITRHGNYLIRYYRENKSNGRFEKKLIVDDESDEVAKIVPLKGNAYLRYQLLFRLGADFDSSIKVKLGEDDYIFFTKHELIRVQGDQARPTGFKSKGEIDLTYLDNQQRLWVCTLDGLYMFDEGRYDRPARTYFQGLSITSILQDLEGNYWVSTLQEGVFKVASIEVEHIDLDKAELKKEKALSIAIMDSCLIIGTSNSRILYLNAKEELKQFYKFPESLEAFIIQKGNSLYSRMGSKLEFDNGQPVVRKLYSDVSTAPINIDDSLVIFGRFNALIIAKQPSATGRGFERVGRIATGKRIMEVLQFPKDTFWMGTVNGLYRSHINQLNDFEQLRADQALLNTRISSLLPLGNVGFWIATMGEGLLFYRQGIIHAYPFTDGKQSELINSLFLQDDHTLWLGGNEGVKKISFQLDDRGVPRIEQVKAITIASGLSTNYINEITEWKGRIWLATEEGLDHFSPDLATEVSHPPSIQVEKVVIDTSDFITHSNPQLAHDQNDVLFHFTAVSFSKPDRVPFYRYRLLHERSDTNWIYTDSRDVQYINLSHGVYRFEVMARNNSGVWSPEAAVYRFRILPHFTQTWWFWVFMFILAIGVVYLLVRRRERSIQQQEAQKRALQHARLQAKEAELESLRSQMNPHFVFNSLNSIQNFIFKRDIEQANYYLSKFSRLMRDSLQFTKLKNIKLDKEIQFISAYLELEQMRFPNRFEFEIVTPEHFSFHQYTVPPLLLQPILENAVKHAFKNISYKGQLRLEFEEVDQKMLQMVVVDNGSGIVQKSPELPDVASGHRSLGLKIIKDRIDLINRDYADEPAYFHIENRMDLNPAANGTKVTICLPLELEAI
ncbi:MAG: histidine kinase [Bacteroidota bacterium]